MNDYYNKGMEALTIKEYFQDAEDRKQSAKTGTTPDRVKGARKKKFLNSSSKIIDPLIKELTFNPDCSYVTVINDCIRQKNIPNYVPILLKNHRFYEGKKQDRDVDMNNQSVFREVLAAQILNYFSVPTAYNVAVYTYNKKGKNYQLASLDFVKDSKKFFNLWLAEQNVVISRDVLDCTQNFERFLGEYYDINKLQIEQLKRTFVMIFLVRMFILGDDDFYDRNIGIIKDEFDKLKLINFDYEFCFENIYDLSIKPNLEMVNSLYPDIYREFYQKTIELNRAVTFVLKENKEVDIDKREMLQFLQESTKFVVEAVNQIDNVKE